jgi:DNA polymerase III subunit gamma/tau
MATYQSLYRRYRSQRFDEVLGQDHITVALRNAVRDGRVGHAYLFSGPRGTGKTSTARILAKVLNCAAPEDGEPCGKCENCVAVAEGRVTDWLLEQDAASKSKVDDMRDLLDRVPLGTSGNRKVIILDEVHMLSQGAENALLKTLEEPPSHVVFVLATTDPQKVRPTILSRTQHFTFRLLQPDVLAAHVRHVIDDAGLGIDPDQVDQAVDHVVRAGGGSARDTLSALDQVAALGAVVDEAEPVDAVLDALADRDPGRVLVGVAQALAAGRDPRGLGEALIAGLRDAFLSLMGVADEHLAEADRARAADMGARFGAAGLTRALDVLGEALTELSRKPDPRIVVEVALVRLTQPSTDRTIDAIVERLDRLERGAAGGAGPGPIGSPAGGPVGGAAPAARSARGGSPDAGSGTGAVGEHAHGAAAGTGGRRGGEPDGEQPASGAPVDAGPGAGPESTSAGGAPGAGAGTGRRPRGGPDGEQLASGAPVDAGPGAGPESTSAGGAPGAGGRRRGGASAARDALSSARRPEQAADVAAEPRPSGKPTLGAVKRSRGAGADDAPAQGPDGAGPRPTTSPGAAEAAGVDTGTAGPASGTRSRGRSADVAGAGHAGPRSAAAAAGTGAVAEVGGAAATPAGAAMAGDEPAKRAPTTGAATVGTSSAAATADAGAATADDAAGAAAEPVGAGAANGAPTRAEIESAWTGVVLAQLPLKVRSRWRSGRWAEVGADGRWQFAVPNTWQQGACDEARPAVERALAEQFGRDVTVAVVVDDEASDQAGPAYGGGGGSRPPSAGTGPAGPDDADEQIDPRELRDADDVPGNGIDLVLREFGGGQVVEEGP